MPPLLKGALSFSALYAFALLSRSFPLAPDQGACRLASGWACVASGIVFVSLARRQPARARLIPAVVLAAAAVVWGLSRLGAVSPPALLARDLAQLTAATLLGAFLASRVDSGEVLLALGIVVTVTDLWSVTRGVTKTLLETKRVDDFLVNFPVLLRSETGFFIGTSDFAMAALYLACSERLGRAWWRAPVAVGFAMALTGTLATLFERPLPVLPFMVTIYHLAFPRDYTLGREGLKLLAAGLAMVGFVAWLYG
ncbi:MAG: hypothetical protein HY303_12915 [Candidatus Wallbacteria bacterium]|nr:hypothetical protein [Candidatus Wallbacteria bacterium]